MVRGPVFRADSEVLPASLVPPHARRRPWVSALRLAVLSLVCQGCTSTTFLVRSRAAERALAEAEVAQSARHASYELILARLYLEKAREEAGEAHYASALDLADRAAQSARRAEALERVRAPGASE